MIKKLLSLAIAIGLSTAAMAQYYYVPGGTGNPGGLNPDVDEPLGFTPGWTSVVGPSQTSPVWSSRQAIPFTFEFNGGVVDSFMVSSTGVVTFSKNPGAAPSASSVLMPSSSLPDSSIAILGIQCSGGNDNVGTKVFGTAPNRQLYISFLSFSVSGSTSFFYYAVVLEESSNRIYICDQRGGTPLQGGISMGLQIDGATGLPINGSPNLGTLSGQDPAVTDNVYFTYIYGTQPAVDANLTETDIPANYGLNSGPLTIGGSIQNLGTDPITSYDVNYSVDGGATVTTNITGVNIATNNSGNFSASTPWTPTVSGTNSIKVWTSNVNGAVDADNSNDTLTQDITIMDFLPHRKVVIEEGTGTWCGWCPRGAVAMEYMQINYPNDFIGIAVHNGDPMVLPEYDNGAGITGFPGMNVDRTLLGEGVNTTVMENHTIDRVANAIPVADVSFVGSEIINDGDSLFARVSATFAGAISGNYRFALIVVEDGVTGTTGSYGQVNYYSGGGNGPLSGAGHDWHLEPGTVPASNMVYDHVGRQLVGGYNGIAGSVPASVAANETIYYNFHEALTTTVLDPENVHFVVVLLDPQGRIVNANSDKPGVYGIGINEVNFASAVYPNPTADFANISLELAGNANVDLQVYDMMGKLLINKTNNLTQGRFNFPIDLSAYPAGIYNVNIVVDGKKVSHKLIVQ